MKVSISSSMAKRVTSAVEKINTHFAVAANPIDEIHTRKHEIATSVKAGEPAPDAFAQEATLRELTVEQLADLVLSKPSPIDVSDERELNRQRLLLAVAAARTPADIDAALAGLA